MMEDDCGGGEVSPTKSGKNDQQFGSTSQGVLVASSSSSITSGGYSTLISYSSPRFFLEHNVNEENKIVEPPIPVFEDEEYATDEDGVVENTLTELTSVGELDQNYELVIENQEFQDPQDSFNVSERQSSENLCYEPPIHGDLGGIRSPCSSQGTSSSIRNLFDEREGIEERASKINTILQAECTGVYEKLHQLIKGHFSDDHAIKRFLSHTIKDVMCTSFYRGDCQPNSGEAEKLEKEFEKLAAKDENKLMAMFGRVLLEKYCTSLESGESQGFFSEEMDTLEIDGKSIAVNRVDVIQDQSGQFHQQNFENKQTVDVKPNLLIDVPSIPDYIPTAEGGEPSNFKKPRKPPTVPKVRVSNEEIWNSANDAKKEYEQNKEKQVEKIGIVFYEDIFTHDEKRTCTASGKNKTAKFDKTKLRFIRAAIAFILGEPDRRSTKAFEKARNQNGFVDLTNSQYDLFKKRVLTEYAYRQRKKIVN